MLESNEIAYYIIIIKCLSVKKTVFKILSNVFFFSLKTFKIVFRSKNIFFKFHQSDPNI